MEKAPTPANDNTPESMRAVDTHVFLERYIGEGKALLQQLEAQREVLIASGMTEQQVNELAALLRYDMEQVAEIPKGEVREVLPLLDELHDDITTVRFVLFGEVQRGDSELAYINTRVKDAFLYKEAQEKQAREQALIIQPAETALFTDLRALAQEGIAVESVMQQAIIHMAGMQRACEGERFTGSSHNVVAYMADSLLTRLQKQVSEVTSTWQSLMRLSNAPVKGIKAERAQLCRADYDLGRELAMRAETLVEYYKSEHQYAHDLQEELTRTLGIPPKNSEGL